MINCSLKETCRDEKVKRKRDERKRSGEKDKEWGEVRGADERAQ